MRRAQRQRLFLVAVAVLLGALAAWTQWRQPAPPPATVLALDPTTIARIDVQAGTTPWRRFEKRDGTWWMVEPHVAPADPEHLDRLANIAAAEVLRWRPASDFDAVRIGLEPPFAVLRLDGHELVFGGLAALAPQRYVRVGDHVALIGARFTGDLAVSPESELAPSAGAP